MTSYHRNKDFGKTQSSYHDNRRGTGCSRGNGIGETHYQQSLNARSETSRSRRNRLGMTIYELHLRPGLDNGGGNTNGGGGVTPCCGRSRDGL